MENNENSRLSFKQVLIIALSSVALFVGLWNFKEVLSFMLTIISYLTPLFAGACLAFVLNVPMKAFERFFSFVQRKCRIKVRHTLNTYLSLILTVGVIAGLITLFINYMAPDITKSAMDIAASAEAAYPKIREFLVDMGVDVASAEEFVTNFNITKLFDYLKNYISFSSTEIMDTVVSAAGTTVSIFITTFSCIVFSIYMITGKKKLNVQFRKLIYAYTPKKFADKTCHIGSLFFKTFTSYISSQCLDALMLALILYVAMTVLRLPYAGIICVLTGLFALIPYVGAFMSCALGVVLILLISPVQALIFLVAFLVVQQLEGQFIYPHVVGGSVGLPAIWTLFAALLGGELMGIFGIIFFIPLTAVIYTLIKEGADVRLTAKEIVVESPLDRAEREKQRQQAEKRERRRRERAERRKERRRKKLNYADPPSENAEDDDDEE
ncbi:MAG: AI-2E family transporter [Clostridia bacterium]|nr:AI-2E family transporter [Clostridia bacterium]